MLTDMAKLTGTIFQIIIENAP